MTTIPSGPGVVPEGDATQEDVLIRVHATDRVLEASRPAEGTRDDELVRRRPQRIGEGLPGGAVHARPVPEGVRFPRAVKKR